MSTFYNEFHYINKSAPVPYLGCQEAPHQINYNFYTKFCCGKRGGLKKNDPPPNVNF